MTDLTLDKILSLLPEKVSLHYVDRGDSFDDQAKLLQKCITEGDIEHLLMQVDEWYIDDHYGFDEVVKQLKSDMESLVDEDTGETVDDLYDQYEDHIRDAIWGRDDSDTITDLFRNTSKFIMFYDTGHEVESSYPMSEAKCRLERYKIKKLLSINTSDYDNLIDQMLWQASYGGQLHIYFRDAIDDYLEIDEKIKSIKFRGEVHIGCVNSGNGSGDITSFKMDFKLPFNRNNLWIDEVTSYNWSVDIAGMCHDWCDSTIVELLEEVISDAVIEDSPMARHMSKEAEYDRVYRGGGCTAGDTNYSRHRNTTYYNQPGYCRNECTKCGTVWID